MCGMAAIFVGMAARRDFKAMEQRRFRALTLFACALAAQTDDLVPTRLEDICGSRRIDPARHGDDDPGALQGPVELKIRIHRRAR